MKILKLLRKWQNHIDRYYTPELFKIRIKNAEDIANQANRARNEEWKYIKKIIEKIYKAKDIEQVRKIIDKEMLNP